MPLYDYQCQACQHTFELLLRSGSEPACPRCGSGALDRLLSLPAPRGKTAGRLASARAQADREGHFSNYAPGERPKIG